MMSIEQIESISRKEARRAAREKRQPYVFYDEAEVRSSPPFHFPFLGYHVPKGWEKVEELFCDSSGFGSPGEPALTVEQLRAKMLDHLASGDTHGYGVVEAGQFQVSLGVYRRKPQARRRRHLTPEQKSEAVVAGDDQQAKK